MKEITPRAQINARVIMPGSKSISHRAALAAALAQGNSRLEGFLLCEDTAYTIRALEELGVGLSLEGETLIVAGSGGRFPHAPAQKKFFLGNSGTSLRLLLSVVCLAQGRWVLTGTPRMQRRPVQDLVGALRQLGVEVYCLNQGGCPPVVVQGKEPLPGGKVFVRADKSSQFLSSLLLLAPCTCSGMEIEVEGPLVSGPYVELTISVMARFGIRMERKGLRHFWVPGGQGYVGRYLKIEGDVSSASYFWAAAAVCGGRVETRNVQPKSLQGDVHFLEVLEAMGCKVEQTPEGIAVEGGGLKGVEVDMSAMPDLVPTLAAVALFARGRTVIHNVPHLRYKESHRLKALAGELRRMGAQVEHWDQGMVIHGGKKLKGGNLEPHEDHRLAMSLAVVGLRVPGVRIKNPHCVAKSFPDFWELWDTL